LTGLTGHAIIALKIEGFMLVYTVTEAKAKFAEVVAKAAAGEEIVLTRLGKEEARIVPPKPKTSHKTMRTDFLSGPFYMAKDFDEWPEDIARDLGIVD
jgi:prevent-host-death family protein